MSYNEKNKRIAKNTVVLYVRLLLSMVISLYTSRIILNALGVEDFGIYNVVAGIVVMFGFLNNAMSAATQRFLSYELGTGAFDRLTQVFSTSITIHFLIAIIVFILAETIGLWLLNTQLNIPAVRMNAANWVYQFSILSFIFSVISIPYSSAIVSHEEMNVFAFVNILEVVLKLFAALMVVWYGFEKLKFYSLLIFLVTVITSACYFLYSTKKFTECKFRFYLDRKLFNKMSSFASWNLLGVFAGITSNQGVNLVLNVFFGPLINAARGIAFQIHGAVNAFVTNFQMAVNPPLIKSYAAGERDYMFSLIFSSSKYSFYILYFLALPILVQTEFILKLWLGTVPEYSAAFTRLVLIDILICSLSGPLQTAVQASGNIKIYQIIVSGILLLNLPASYLFLKLGYSPKSAFFVSIAASTTALAARLLILNKIIFLPIKDFFRLVIIKVFIVFFAAAIIPYLMSIRISHSISNLFIMLFISCLSVVSSVWLVGIGKNEREMFKKFLNKILVK